MGAETITRDDLLDEVAAFLRQDEPIRPSSEWFTVSEMVVRMLPAEPSITMTRLRDRLDTLVRKGLFEKKTFGGNKSYYRKL